MSEHLSLERTHDLIDGVLSSAATSRARRHLETCEPCRDRYASLAELTAELRSVPRDAAPPPPEAWEAIARRIDGTKPSAEPEADVLVLPGTRPARRRVSFTIPQLAAASLVLAVTSAGTLWMAMSRPSTEPAPIAAPAGEARFATDDASYDMALDELMTIVETARPYLAPETLLALDESLAEIDAAIAEIGAALENDPSSGLLQSMLVNQQRSKLRVLSQVATLTQARS